jgi:hypothetical protein
LLGFLSYIILKQSQFNTVVPSQKEMDRVGFEPTTSARCKDNHISSLKGQQL